MKAPSTAVAQYAGRQKQLGVCSCLEVAEALGLSMDGHCDIVLQKGCFLREAVGGSSSCPGVNQTGNGPTDLARTLI